MEQAQSAQSNALRLSWQTAREAAAPADQDTAFNELGRCLTLCAPSGMSEDERTTWLATAYAEICHIPAKPFLSATAKARQQCDHPAKIIPTIIRESKEWADSLLSVERTKRKQYENANAPKLGHQDYEMPDDERDEIAELLKQTTASLKTAPPIA